MFNKLAPLANMISQCGKFFLVANLTTFNLPFLFWGLYHVLQDSQQQIYKNHNALHQLVDWLFVILYNYVYFQFKWMKRLQMFQIMTQHFILGFGLWLQGSLAVKQQESHQLMNRTKTKPLLYIQMSWRCMLSYLTELS